MDRQDEVTRLLEDLTEGDESVLDRLLTVVYDELRRLAHHQLRRERPDHTLNTTDLVHEAYLRLVRLDRIEWKNRGQFLAIAAQAMRRVLVDYAVRRRALKRGGDVQPVPLDLDRVSVQEAMAISEAQADRVLALDEALKHLKTLSTRQHLVVEYRFFGGLTVEETAEVLGISTATVKRDWNFARAWLNKVLRETGTDEL